MDFNIKQGAAAAHKTAALVLPVYEGRVLATVTQAVDEAAKGAISAILKKGDFEGKSAQTLVLYGVAGVAADRVILLGMGKAEECGISAYRKAVKAVSSLLQDSGAGEACFALLDEAIKGETAIGLTNHAVLMAQEAAYRFDQLKSKVVKPSKPLAKLTLLTTSAATAKAATAQLATAKALANGIDFTKDLGNLPGNYATPTYLAEEALKLKKLGIKVTVLERKDCEKLGMGSFISVTQGSAQPPKFIVLEWLGGNKKDKPTVLVGKGVTFDTGGISLKPGPDMDHMKYDMSGAGSVLGVFRALGELKPKNNVIGLIVACENMPSSRATKPGDVFTSMSGQTIEVLNTDAEGRLILCDALTYAERYNPRAVIDIATLTGACVIALGHVVAAVYATQDSLANDLITSGQQMHDRLWRMPLLDDYQEGLNSNFADMANIAGRAGGSITAACFLWRFAKKYDWAHLDIAGVAYTEGKAKGATGRPVSLLFDYVLKHA
jgi:leucyl aminopeptidase